jgi:catechol 2,3-dioxygenase-like lactoylglutathione lyase family enzyme
MRYQIHHVQIAAPPGSEEAARSFYVGVLGMDEMERPPALRARGGLWLRLDASELHIGIEPGFRPAEKAHPAFEVDDLEAVRARLRERGFPTTDDGLLPGRRRFYTTDPFGNRLEFVGAG